MDTVTLFFIGSNVVLIFFAGHIIDAVSDYLLTAGRESADVETFLRWALFVLNSIVFYGIVRRYNARILKDAEKLRSSEEDLHLYGRMFQSLQEGVLITDSKNRIVAVNRSFTRMTGYTENEVTGRNPRILHSGRQSRRYYNDMWRSLRQTGSWRGEMWNRRKDGTVFPEWLTINTVTDTTGHVVNYVGIFSDMTERKRADERLRLHARVFESSHEGIMITDTKGIILSVNPAFTVTTGFTAEEAVGRTPKILHSGRQDKAFYIEMWSSIHTTGSWQGEIWNRRKNGEIYPEWLTIKAVKDEGGEISTYVAIFTDITERKQAEENLKYLAHYDVLTGLPNRRRFQMKLNRAMERAGKDGTQVGLLFIDLDRFKVINDTLGHKTGDMLLIQAAERLRRLSLIHI